MTDRIIEFIRQRDYVLVQELGQGACGKTVLLHDDQIDEYFVCKKYSPYSESEREVLFANFVRETKLLHQVFHRNVVRVFNYYLYPDRLTGYILMEYIKGLELDKYLRQAPERTSEMFSQAVEAFAYLESIGVLHRDVRPRNVLVRNDGTLKVIDLGFGKKIAQSEDFDKSISLNWWCEPPAEFAEGRYDFATEVYFVGNLFERIIKETSTHQFQHLGLLREMCERDPANRISSFQKIALRLRAEGFSEIEFTEQEKKRYQTFSASVRFHLTKIEEGARYADDIDFLRDQLDEAYRSVMLETTAPTAAPILRCLVDGAFYHRRNGFSVDALGGFVRLLRDCPPDKARTILANLYTTLDTVPRFASEESNDEEVPF